MYVDIRYNYCRVFLMASKVKEFKDPKEPKPNSLQDQRPKKLFAQKPRKKKHDSPFKSFKVNFTTLKLEK